ncbi:MAG: metallophosphatase family protein [Anaerolineales bacterium]|nr:metallophosphatase family protein [Anaerolineales bacterium]NUQ83928.1 metallophosphoesterase family protein [Anaerolineales bacterium]
MRVLVISDIHANYTALEAVLKNAGEVDATWCLGDMVGYGPDPNAVMEQIREIPNLTCILGNHDMAVIGRIPFEVFNTDARRTLEYHERVLTADNMDFLRSLPSNLKTLGDVSIVHGSPRDSVWEYILNALSARLNFDHFTTAWCLVGHSHLQCMFQLDTNTDRVSLSPIRAGEHYPLRPRAIINPGSVGQPRDRDPRAAYAIYDTESYVWEPRRVEYNISEVQRRIRESNLPEKHAIRLAEGW